MSRYNPSSTSKTGFKDRIVVSSRGNVRNDVSTSITTRTSRVKHIATDSFHSPQLVYLNITSSQTEGDMPNVNPVTYGAAIEFDGAIYPASLNGQTLVTVAGGQALFFDPVPLGILKGETYWVRTYTQVNAGESVPTNYSGSSGQGEGYVGDNKTLYNSTAIGALNGNVTTAAAIIGTVTKPTVSIALIGDSIMNGFKDYSYQGFGYRFCTENGFAHLNMGFPGERASSVAKNGKRIRQVLLPYVTHAIVEYGVNDLINGATTASLLADMQRMWDHLSKLGIVVFQTTITPYSSSTDSFATLENQTVAVNAGFTGGANSKRSIVNRALKAVPTPLKAVFDVASAVESSDESGLWKVNGTNLYYTDDGLHPKGPGHDLMLAKLDAKLFTL